MATNRDPLKDVAEPIKSLMDSKRFSINGLANQTLIPYSTLRRHLIDPDQLTMGNVLRIAEALGVGPAELLPTAKTAASNAA